MPTIAVDAMGGDSAPDQVVRGAVVAQEAGHDVVLVGDADQVEPILEKLGADLPVEHAGQVIEMDDDPARAIREKKDASVSVAARLVATGDADALVSAGSTGAALAAAAFIIGRLPGVSRPAIASVFPTGDIILDAGANIDVRPEHLVQFAVMGTAIGQVYAGIEAPRVGLLNIGEEDGKGRELDRSAYPLLEAAGGINFIGNVEGRDLGTGTVDVFVTDGFTGNVLLKTVEGTVRAFYRMLLEAIQADEYQEALATLMPAFMSLRAYVDPENVGGAHLLGTKGVVVIAHGSSSQVAIANAIEMATAGARERLTARIAAGIEATRAP
jgi:glycerol-3-phosphate acyltransferase PlsX